MLKDQYANVYILIYIILSRCFFRNFVFENLIEK